ncbi:MAG: glycoside hydrolase family 3 N-terminal domain-containing protein [Acutalibacteraceae bacterium]
MDKKEGYTEKEIKSEDIEKIRSMIKSMSLHDKICQMIVASPESLTSVENATLAGEKTKEALMKYPVGGIIYFSNNIVDKEQTVNLLYNTQTYSEIPLMLCVDEEGKNVSRVGVKLGENIPDDMYSYKERVQKKQRKMRQL